MLCNGFDKDCFLRKAIFLLLLLPIWCYSQEISLDVKNVPFEEVLKEIQRKTDYRFVYTREEITGIERVSLAVSQKPLSHVLEQLFNKLPLGYAIEGQFIVLRKKERPVNETGIVNGRVTDEDGNPLEGATVQAEGRSEVMASDATGEFEFKELPLPVTLIISNVGYGNARLLITKGQALTIRLKRLVNNLDETVVIAYGTTTRRLSTGSIGRITEEDIRMQPVSNPLAALQGRIAGVVVNPTNGVPGARFKVEVRGKTSVGAVSSILPVSNEPLILVDGVPLATGNNPINVVSSIASLVDGGGISILNTIDPASIESIEVLKDADATAIYGSRGSNGVILINTKKGSTGKLKFAANVNTGISKIGRGIDFLNTAEYVALRKEAFANSGMIPDNSNAYDLLLFDTTKYTDFARLFFGGTARRTNVQSTLSGGTPLIQYRIGAGYLKESTVLPGDMNNEQASLNSYFNLSSANKKFNTSFSLNYGYEHNRLISENLSNFLTLPPDYPDFFDDEGKLEWEYKGVFLDNPLAYLKKDYTIKADNLSARLFSSLEVAKGLVLQNSMGYNIVLSDELSKSPYTSLSPFSTAQNSSSFGTSKAKTWIAEPQISYKGTWHGHQLTILAGGTLQQGEQSSLASTGYNYANDALLGAISAAGTIVSQNSVIENKYAALFGRINYNYADRYLLTLSGRKDGSSRFGPGKQYAQFGAVGAGWILSSEKWMKEFRFLSFAKLKGSYGSTGNDKIGDYQYLNTWTTGISYQGNGSLAPTALYNPDYRWEINRKLESSLELGFFKDRLFTSGNFYRNRSSNQLVQYKLPNQTGFQSVIANFPAVVENSGFEAEIQGSVIKRESISWKSSLIISFPKNRLVSFPDLENSSYTSLVIGEPLSVYGGFEYRGVDAQTGAYQFLDKTGHFTTLPSTTTDWNKAIGNLEPDYYGGIKNTVRYKGIVLDVYIDFKKQNGENWLSQIESRRLGSINNFPRLIWDRWKSPGDKASLSQVNINPASVAYKASTLFGGYNSTGKYSDASFLRLSNVYLGYQLPKDLLGRVLVTNAELYVQAHNVFFITHYKGADPETQNLFSVPPLKTFAAGLNIQF